PTAGAAAPGLACSPPVPLPVHCAVCRSRPPVVRRPGAAWFLGPGLGSAKRACAPPPLEPPAIPWSGLPAWLVGQGNSPSVSSVAVAPPPTAGPTAPWPARPRPIVGTFSTVAAPAATVVATASRPGVVPGSAPTVEPTVSAELPVHCAVDQSRLLVA